ncbi:MAG TPA: isoamylase early set domain-containing protein [Gemmatimonadales bacterium]|nr:isoamylase early set domain-containing protein [Gemmatimonadales bacterium]
MTMSDFHPQVKQLLDGELTLADLPPELRAEGEEALSLLAAVDREPVTFPGLDGRVLAQLGRRAKAPRFRPWMLVPAFAAGIALALLFIRPVPTPAATTVTVRFVLFAPEAQQVALAGTFNQWDAAATPLVRTEAPGVWAATLTLPAGQHQYAFVLDGARWIADPAAPAVDDGFGRRNSVLSL